jgi:4-amino-4-deoxy-L-arabinose transferase-like glycosyltransferase
MPYPIVLWPLIRTFGTGEAVLRAPAVIAGTASVPALWWAARRLSTPAVALGAAALLAINPMAVWYSQMARPYAFVMLAGSLAFGALPRALEDGGRRPWAGYVASMALLAYCDLLAAPIVLPAQALIAWRARRDGLKRWLWSLLALLIVCIPLLVAAAIARSRRDALYWLPKPDRSLVSITVQEFTGGFSGVSAVRWATVAAVALLLAGAVWSLRRVRAVNGGLWSLAIALSWGVLPIVLLFAVSFAHPLFWPRYAIVALPGLSLLVAVAAHQLWRSRAGMVAAAGLVGIVVVAAVYADARQRTTVQENWLAPAAWLRERPAGAPTILDNVLMLPPLGYYDPAFRTRDGDLIVQEWRDRPLPRGVVGFKDPRGYGNVPNGPPSASTLASLARSDRGSVWMVVAQSDAALQGDVRGGAAVAWARAHCRLRVRQSVGVWVMHASACRG